MASRPAWTIRDGKVISENFKFVWNSGFALVQSRKNISNLHSEINLQYNQTALEVSSKSNIELGRKIGAFNLKLDGVTLENIFQSSKKYENGGPYIDLIDVEPKLAKTDERHKNSGRLISFFYNGEDYSIEPKTLFYDYIYVKALFANYSATLDLSEYEWFTDIMFNPRKSINCQARSAAIYKLIRQLGCFDVLNSKEDWLAFHVNRVAL